MKIIAIKTRGRIVGLLWPCFFLPFTPFVFFLPFFPHSFFLLLFRLSRKFNCPNLIKTKSKVIKTIRTKISSAAVVKGCPDKDSVISLCPSVRLAVCPSGHPSIHPAVLPSVRLSFHPSVLPSFLYTCAGLSVNYGNLAFKIPKSNGRSAFLVVASLRGL